MSQPTTDSSHRPNCGAWTREHALQLAWTTWFILLATPFLVLPFALHMTPIASGNGPKPELAEKWFLIVMVYLLVSLPLALLIRSYLFRSFWQGQSVVPRRYYVGVFIPWAAAAVAGLVAELACIATATLVPNILPALLALFVYLMLWPTGAVMDPPAGADRRRIRETDRKSAYGREG